MTVVTINIFILDWVHFCSIYLKSWHFCMWEEELLYLFYHIWLWEKKMIKAQLYNWQSSRHQQQVFLLQAPAVTRNYLLTAALQAGVWLLGVWGSGQMAAGGRGEEATAAGEGQTWAQVMLTLAVQREKIHIQSSELPHKATGVLSECRLL